MRRTIIAFIVAATFAATVFAQTGTVTLQNQESAPFYYVVDPADLSDLTAGSPLLASRVATFFSAKGTDPAFSKIDPQADASLTGLMNGSHLLVGFFAVQDLNDFPVRVLAVQADSQVGTRFYALFASPSQLTVPRGTGRLVSFARADTTQVAAAAEAAPTTAATADQSATTTPTSTPEAAAAAAQPPAAVAPAQAAAPPSAAAPLPSIAAFSSSYDPVVFTRETNGSFAVLPIAESKSWEHAGTRITDVAAASDGGTLRLALTVPGGFSEKVSYFLYVFTDRSAGNANALTLEIEPRANGSRGACILWVKGSDQPSLVGEVESAGVTVEVTLDSKKAPADIAPLFAEASSVDLTAGWYDRALGTWEEFYYTTIAMADIPADATAGSPPDVSGGAASP